MPQPKPASWKRLGVLLLALFFLYGAAMGAGATSPLEGQRAPSFTAQIVAGAAHEEDALFDLDAHRGRVVVLDFWASWCPPCRASVPELAAFARQHPEVDVVGVNVEMDRDAAWVGRVHASLEGTYPTVHDASGAIQQAYLVTQLPTLLVIRDGLIVASHMGAVDAAWLEAQTTNALR